jgi:hypothetical protein
MLMLCGAADAQAAAVHDSAGAGDQGLLLQDLIPCWLLIVPNTEATLLQQSHACEVVS